MQWLVRRRCDAGENQQNGERSARGPGELAAAEEVDVQMRDGFAAVGAVVDDEAVALGEIEVAGDARGDEEEVAEEGLLGAGGVGEARNGFLGDDEDVDWRLGADVVKGVAELVLVGGRAGDFAVDDALENGAVGHGEGKVYGLQFAVCDSRSQAREM